MSTRSSAPLPGRRLPRPVREFLDTEASGGIVLLAGAVVALLWANSPWDSSYDQLWRTELLVEVGRFTLAEDLRSWVNDALMAVFFFTVGLEIKQELVHGELRQWRTAALPALAAMGGMVVPALLYAALNTGGPGQRGWGIPMVTDIAFAVGVVALLGNRVPSSLKLFLLTLAIVDDIGAIAVIAVFYSEGIDVAALGAAVALLVTMVVLRRSEITWAPLYGMLGIAVWLAVFVSGVHATIAGVALALITPARSMGAATVAREWASDLTHDLNPADLRTMTRLARASVSPAARLQHRLHPVTSFVIVPLFALANAGVALEADALDAPGAGAVAAGVALGLVAGKAIGITGFSWAAVRLGLGSLPAESRWVQVAGVATVAGIGFTVSLFIAGLAFADADLQEAAKIGILGASILAAGLGTVLVRATSRHGTGLASEGAPAGAARSSEVGSG